MAELTVYPETLRWATRVAKADPSAVSRHKGLQDFPLWLEATDPITVSFQKVHDLAVVLQTSFGALVRSALPDESEDELVRYRTVGNETVEPSKNLLDTISMMRARQNWARDELIQDGLSENALVGSVSGSASDEDLAQAILDALRLDEQWAKGTGDERVRFNKLKERASAAGLMIMQNSQVGHQRRPLNIEEFRAFALVDDVAPLIFINRNDSYAGMLFSLLHEIVHVLLGEPEIYDDAGLTPAGREIERTINRAVMKSVLSDEDFAVLWREQLDAGLSRLEAANAISQEYGLSALAFGIRARQADLADEQLIEQLRDQMQQDLRAREHERRKSSGGNGNATNASRLDTGFVRLVKGGIESGTLSYTDGFGLLNIKSAKSYDGLLAAKGLG
ncbi:putative Zn peptidase [Bifidobacterium actinocoloniiforme DSM 22766]|uniref:Putative Zn peptidase n=1 Tax=Bifidobacterium actinocoloniiforme DSM 22766 TaxID=1437605 RepID=A0A086YWG0_9BIFI|nr:ImmA/IrrE family metallo-endopeptidase [Bifidobacterium actinocoloniiforme]AKV55806.1 hypothetical protein AB656_06130 [Bifidobacterium actinocoloniiforme DSM 22766]KFI38610.1 putative Zn peptidase [Bifidobacterium actinocoloniiforme DSM 22766]